MGVKIKLNNEQTIRFKACFIDNARKILVERKLTQQTEVKKECLKVNVG